MLLAVCSCWLALACTCCVLCCVTMAMRWHFLHCEYCGRRAQNNLNCNQGQTAIPHRSRMSLCCPLSKYGTSRSPASTMSMSNKEPNHSEPGLWVVERRAEQRQQQQQQQQQQQHNRTIKATSQKRHVAYVLSVRTSKPKELPSCPERAAPRISTRVPVPNELV